MDNKIEFEINYFGNDGSYNTDTFVGSLESLAKQITFLEERGCHNITVYNMNNENVIYEFGGFINSIKEQ